MKYKLYSAYPDEPVIAALESVFAHEIYDAGARALIRDEVISIKFSCFLCLNLIVLIYFKKTINKGSKSWFIE